MMLLGVWIATCLCQDRIEIDERMRISQVALDVIAYQRKSGPVYGLTQSDFKVYENGRVMTLDYFDIRDFRETEPKLPTEADFLPGAQNIQQIIFVLDLEAAQGGLPFKALDMLEQTLESLKDGNAYRIALYSMESGMLTDGFVGRIAEVLQILASYRSNYLDRGYGDEDSLLFPKPRNRFKVALGKNKHISQLNTSAPDITELEESFSHCLNHEEVMDRLRCLQATFRDFIELHSIRTERVIGQLESLAYAFEDVKGQKIMLFISPGFGLNQLQSAQKLYRIYRDIAQEHRRIEEHHLDDLASASSGLTNDGNFNRVLHACIRNRVIFHTFDVFHKGQALTRRISATRPGLSHPAIIDAFRLYTQDMDSGLRHLAEDSGGSFFLTGKLDTSVRKALDTNRYFYVLGYKSPSGKPGKFRKIKIKVKGRKTKLLYRKGYYGS